MLDDARDLLGLHGGYWENVGYLAGIVVVLVVASLTVLYVKKKPI